MQKKRIVSDQELFDRIDLDEVDINELLFSEEDELILRKKGFKNYSLLNSNDEKIGLE